MRLKSFLTVIVIIMPLLYLAIIRAPAERAVGKIKFGCSRLKTTKFQDEFFMKSFLKETLGLGAKRAGACLPPSAQVH